MGQGLIENISKRFSLFFGLAFTIDERTMIVWTHFLSLQSSPGTTRIQALSPKYWSQGGQTENWIRSKIGNTVNASSASKEERVLLPLLPLLTNTVEVVCDVTSAEAIGDP